MLKKFIEKRDEMIKQESIKISKESSEEEIYKFIKEKLNFNIDKQNIKELNLDKYENINEEVQDEFPNDVSEGNEDYEIYQKVKNNNKINL